MQLYYPRIDSDELGARKMPMTELTQDLAARAAVEDLINRYGAALDSRDAVLLAGCFTRDAVYVLDGSKPSVYSGRDEIVRSLTRLFDSTFARTTHLMGRPQIEFDGMTG